MWKAIAVLVLTLLAGAVYDSIKVRFDLGADLSDADTLIESLRADNRDIQSRLDASLDRVLDLEGTLGDLERTNTELGERLSNSQRIVRELREENQRLGDAIAGGLDTAGSATDSSRELGATISRIGHILDRYTDGTGTEPDGP